MPTKLDPWKVYERLGWRPHKGQREVIGSTARHRVVSAGRRFGKSEIGGHELVPEALLTYDHKPRLEAEGKRREFWIVGPEYSDAEKEFRVLWNSIKALGIPFDKPGSYNDPIQGNLHISLWGGAFQVHGKSAKYPETLVGEGLRGVVLAEAAKLKERVWTKFLRPTLADYEGWSLHSSTPEGKNWFYENWQRGIDPNNPDWASWRMPSWRNPYVYKKLTEDAHVKQLQSAMARGLPIYDYIEEHGLQVDDEVLSLMNDLTAEAFNQEIGADFTEFVGRVFKEFDEELHVFDLQYNPAWQTYAAADYGFTNPNVWLLIQIGPWGEVHVLDELYERNLTAVEFAQRVKETGLCPPGLRVFYPDPADPGSSRILSEKLGIRVGGGTGAMIRDRLDAIRRALKLANPHLPDGHPDKLPQLRINRSCKNTIYEFNEYRYPERKETALGDAAPENPMKKDDHTPEALGRFFSGHFGTPQNSRSGVIRHKPRFASGRKRLG